MGPRNWTMFQLGIVTALRASDICKLRYKDVFVKPLQPRDHIFSTDIKTNKPNNSYIAPLKKRLINYDKWLRKKRIYSKWLFPVFGNYELPVKPHYLYVAMKHASHKLDLHYVGSHSLRKTFGYIAYKRTHNLVYVMRMLNHTNPEVTFRYIGLRQEAMDNITKKIFSGQTFFNR